MQRLVAQSTLRRVDHAGTQPVSPLSNRVSAPRSMENEYLRAETFGQMAVKVSALGISVGFY